MGVLRRATHGGAAGCVASREGTPFSAPQCSSWVWLSSSPVPRRGCSRCSSRFRRSSPAYGSGPASFNGVIDSFSFPRASAFAMGACEGTAPEVGAHHRGWSDGRRVRVLGDVALQNPGLRLRRTPQGIPRPRVFRILLGLVFSRYSEPGASPPPTKFGQLHEAPHGGRGGDRRDRHR